MSILQCGSDGGRGVGAGHLCVCNGPVGHSLAEPRPHGCCCGAMWACADCEHADPIEGCAECGAMVDEVAL